jgi:tripartite-type tricarboxylate transporter receptor subunit TctC
MGNDMRLTHYLSIYSLGLLIFFASGAFAQSNYPNKPINLIVPYGALL